MLNASQTGLINSMKEVTREEERMFLECHANILKNVNRNLTRMASDSPTVNKLLSVRWFLCNEANLAIS